MRCAVFAAMLALLPCGRPAVRTDGGVAAATSRPASTASYPVEQFVVSYWWGPPGPCTTRERYRQIRDAHFNVAGPPGIPGHDTSVERNRKILDFCHELGMKAIVADSRMPAAVTGVPDAATRLDAIVADYGRHPALLAYFVTDEPSAGAFAGLAEVADALRARDPAHPAYVNLFPTYAAPWSQLGTATYGEYLDQFARTVRPFVLSYDHYPFLNGGDRPDFFENLAAARNASLKAGVPFWTIAQVVAHYDYRDLAEGELRFQAMQALAFGAKGLLWYTYWYPGPSNPTVRNAMIDFDGTPNANYARIASINADVRAIGDELLAARSWAAFHTGEGLQFPAPEGSPIVADARGRLTIGVFTADDGRATMALVTNRDYRNAVRARVIVTPAQARVEQLSPVARRWSDARRDGGDRDGIGVSLELPPGGGTLLRW